MKGKAPWSLRVFSAATMCGFALIALAPVAMVLVSSFWVDGGLSLDACRSVLAEGRQWALLRNSLTIALGAASLATLAGAAFAWAIERRQVAGRRFLVYGAAVSFLIPPYVSATVWIDVLGSFRGWQAFSNSLLQDSPRLFNPHGVMGAILVLAASYYPIVALTAAISLRRYDKRLEEAARLFRGKGPAFLWVTWPILAPGVLSGSLLVFLLSLVDFSVPSLLQVNVYPVEVYSRFSAFYDVAGATAQALPLLVCGAIVLALYGFYVRPRRAWLTGQVRNAASEGPSERESRTGLRRLWAAYAWCLVGLTAVFPVAVLLRRTASLTSLYEVWQTAQEEIMTSMVVAVASATLLTLLAFSMAYLRRREPRWRFLHPLGLLPFLVSGPVLGIGLIGLLNRPGWLFEVVFDSVLVVVLACTARFLFFALLGVSSFMSELHPRLEEAAAVAGVSWRRQLTGVILPLMRPALLGVWSLAFVFSLRELDATVLVCPPGATTLPVRLFTLMHYGPSRLVAALSLLSIAVVLVVGGLAAHSYRRMRKMSDARG